MSLGLHWTLDIQAARGRISLHCLKWNWMKSLLNPYPRPHLEYTEPECLAGSLQICIFDQHSQRACLSDTVLKSEQWTGSPLLPHPLPSAVTIDLWSQVCGDVQPNVTASKPRMGRGNYLLVHVNYCALGILSVQRNVLSTCGCLRDTVKNVQVHTSAQLPAKPPTRRHVLTLGIGFTISFPGLQMKTHLSS